MTYLVKNCPTQGLTTWMVIQTFYAGLNFTSRNLLDSAAGGTFMSTTLGAATKLLDEMILNYCQWHTERSPTGKKVNSVEEFSSLNEKVDLIMSLLSKQAPIDPHDVPLNSLVAQEQVDVNFISRKNFNNNAYRSNFGSNNPRPFPSNNYGNNNTYPSTKNSTSELESILKDFITTQKALKKSVEEKLDKLDSLSLKVDNIAHDVEMLKIRTSPLEERKTTPMSVIQVQINETIRMLAKLKERWAREKEEEDRINILPTHHTIATNLVVEDLKTVSTHHTPSPPGPINCDAGSSTSVMPKRMYDMLELKPFDPCSFGVRLVDSSVKKPLGKIDDVLIIVSDNYVPVDFTIMDIECEPSFPIILGRPFLRTVGAIIDMKEELSNSNSLSRKGWKTYLGKRLSYLLSPSHGLVILLKKLDLLL